MTQLVEGFALSASSFSTCHFGFMDAVKTLFNSATWLFFIASISFTLLQVTKLVILDAIWPVLVIVVSFAGVFAIPLGLLPGIESFRGWIRSLIEVALWPIIIAMILAVMTATFKQTISETLTAQPQEERIALVTCDDLRLMLQADETNPDRLRDPALRREQTSIIQKMLKMTALTIATILFLLGTPLLAGSLTRGQTAEALGGLLGGKAAGVAKEPLQTVRATERDDVKRAHRAQQGTRATRGFIHRIRTAMGSSGDST